MQDLFRGFDSVSLLLPDAFSFLLSPIGKTIYT